MTETRALLGYADQWSVAPGETVSFMVSGDVHHFEGEIVRLTHGGPRPSGEPDAFEYEVIREAESYKGGVQPLLPGSYARVDRPFALDGGALSLTAWIFPTLPEAGEPQGIIARQSLADHRGFNLALDGSGRLAFSCYANGGKPMTFRGDCALARGRWCFVGCSLDPAAGTLTLYQAPTSRGGADAQAIVASISDAAVESGGPLLIAGAGLAAQAMGRETLVGGFNGKIDRPRIFGAALGERGLAEVCRAGDRSYGQPLGDWDFTKELSSARIIDVSGNGLDGVTINGPLRAMTGHNWSGRHLDYRLAPTEYGAIHFHSDDMLSAEWLPSLDFTPTDQNRSGMYAAHVFCSAGEDFIPFCVRPRRSHPTAPVAFLAPTFTYMAYSNFETRAATDPEALTGRPAVHDPNDAYITDHPELGYSMYNSHLDGSGIARVSSRRPMMDIRPQYRFWLTEGGWALSSDMYLIDWLEAEGITYDVITDGDLDSEGVEILDGYRAVITGSHPEYVTESMLDAFDSYTAHGGRVMYLGGNGFYWVTTVDPLRSDVIEIRRGDSGTRTWTSRPGETHHSTTGEPGGQWRQRGRPPQAMFGVGFVAQGGGDAAPYAQTEAARSERASFILAGIGPEELIGDFGNHLGGAAGAEIDRADERLGTPPHTLVVATSAGRHSDHFQRAVEELEATLPGQGGTSCPEVRADMTFFETPQGGAVFSVGSISWSASLSHNGFDNNVARLTKNVLQRFIEP
jgi:N,N-dimethylformamidase